MSRHSLRERAIHGTPAFPIEVYRMNFDDQASVLAPLHFHREFEFCVVTEGRLIIQVNENSFELSKGEGIFINSEYLHSIVPSGSSASGFIALLFDAGLICAENDILYSKYISPLIQGTLTVSEKLSEAEIALVAETERIYNSKNHGYEFDVKSTVINLVSALLKSTSSSSDIATNKKREIVKRTIEYIRESYESTVTLSMLASNVYVSPEYLCRIFSEMSDSSPIEYLNRYRIMQAAKLLLRDAAAVSEISSRCGFNNSSYFNKLFMRYVGCTPTEYRRYR